MGNQLLHVIIEMSDLAADRRLVALVTFIKLPHSITHRGKLLFMLLYLSALRPDRYRGRVGGVHSDQFVLKHW